MNTPDFTIKPAAQETPKSEPPKKRGRPAGTTNAAKNASVTEAEIKQALKVMDSLYSFVGTALMLGQFPMAAAQWGGQSEELSKQNATTLAASPQMVRWLIKQGNTGGSGAFILQNGMAFAMLGLTVRGEMAVRRAAREYKEEQERAAQQAPGVI